MCLVSNHTNCPFLNGTKFDFICSAIRLLSNLCAARASSLVVTKFLIFSVTDGNFVCSKVVGIANGASPCISLKEVFVRSACHRLLWVNSNVNSELFHSIGCAEQ